MDCTIDTSGERQPESAWSLALLGWSPRSSSSAPPSRADHALQHVLEGGPGPRVQSRINNDDGQAYFEVVDRWFPRFCGDLRLESKRPFKLIGMVRTATEPKVWHRGPCICYYREPNLSGPDFTVNLQLGNESAWKTFLEHVNDRLENRQIDSFRSSVLDVFDLDAAEKLTYSWLLDDLRQVHWIR